MLTLVVDVQSEEGRTGAAWLETSMGSLSAQYGQNTHVRGVEKYLKTRGRSQIRAYCTYVGRAEDMALHEATAILRDGCTEGFGRIETMHTISSYISSSLLRLLEQIMAHPPCIPALPLEQFRTGKVEDLPSVPPRYDSFLSIRLQQPRPDRCLILTHGDQPVLTRLAIMHPVHPPLLLDSQIVLEIQQQIRRRHRAAREEVFRHPSAFEIIRGRSMCEDVYKQFAPRS